MYFCSFTSHYPTMSSLLNRLSCTALRRPTAKCPLTSLVTSLSTCSSNNTTGGSNKSYERGAPPHKVLHQTIGDCLEEASTRFASRGHSALVSCKEGGLRWSYAELYSRAQAVAKGLLAVGLPPLARYIYLLLLTSVAFCIFIQVCVPLIMEHVM